MEDNMEKENTSLLREECDKVSGIMERESPGLKLINIVARYFLNYFHNLL